MTFDQNGGQNACQQRNIISSSRVRKLAVSTISFDDRCSSFNLTNWDRSIYGDEVI